MLAPHSASTTHGPLAQSRRFSVMAALCLLLATAIPVISSPPAHADMRKQVRVDTNHKRKVVLKIRKLRRLVKSLKQEQRSLENALDASAGPAPEVESAAMLRMWQRVTVLKERMQDARRTSRRLGRLRREIASSIHDLQVALTHIFRVCPVDEPRSYVDDFGVLMRRDEFGVPTKDRKKWHRHQGIDMFSMSGTPIRAPFPGWARVATNPVGGIAVKVFGSQGFVYNAHLSAYGHTGWVEEGTIIGYVGNTGDALGTMSHDHFEWHPGNGPAVDPYHYLNQACR